MTSSEATAHIFLSAIRALRKSDREAVLAGIAEDQDLLEDIVDLAILAERANEPSRPFSEYEKERKRKRKTK